MPCDNVENRPVMSCVSCMMYCKYLCQACKFLDREQLINISFDNKITLYAWYGLHLLKDIDANKEINNDEVEIAKKELKRLGIEYTYENVEIS